MTPLDADTEAALRAGKQQILERFGGDPNVTGVGLAYRMRAGRWVDELVVSVLVARKRPEAMISRARLLPKTVHVDGRARGVDVIQAGPFAPYSTLAGAKPARGSQRAADLDATTQQPVRPPEQGVSISNLADGTSGGGTLGCFVVDATDGTICLLSSNHAIARDNAGASNQAIIQPAAALGGTKSDRIAGLKRFATLANSTEVDAAIAQLDDQSPVTGFSATVVGGTMAPINPAHPAVGMIVFGSVNGGACLLTRMDATLAALNVSLLTGSPPSTANKVDASAAVQAPVLFTNLEMQGAASGHKSATILGVGFSVAVPIATLGQIRYDDLILTVAFGAPGDSGAVACLGGEGNLHSGQVPCGLLGALSAYYAIPLNSSANSELADDLRDGFLMQTITGQLMVAVTYANTQTVIDRLNNRSGTAHNQAMAQARAQALYSQFHSMAAQLIDSKSPTAVVTSKDLNVVQSVLLGLTLPTADGGTSMLTGPEASAALTLYSQVLKPTLGMNKESLLHYMNEHSVFQKVFSQLSAVPTVLLPGPVSLFRDAGPSTATGTTDEG